MQEDHQAPMPWTILFASSSFLDWGITAEVVLSQSLCVSDHYPYKSYMEDDTQATHDMEVAIPLCSASRRQLQMYSGDAESTYVY